MQPAYHLPAAPSSQSLSRFSDGDCGLKKEASQMAASDSTQRPAQAMLIFVRPPPSNFSNPLSLQVQFIPPRSTARILPVTAETETDASSSYASSTSVSTSASSKASSSRRQIPLFNLHLRNKFSTISDATTDCAVAKFRKSSLDVLGLAVLEPKELWVTPDELPPPLPFSPSTPSLCPSHPTPINSSVAARPVADDIVVDAAVPTGRLKKQGFFSKFIRRKQNGNSAETACLELPCEEQPNSVSVSIVPPSPAFAVASTPRATASPNIPTPMKILGTCPTYSAVRASRLLESCVDLRDPGFITRPHIKKYIWTVRRWLKASDNGLSKSLADKPVSVDVSFEWKKTKSPAMREQLREAKRRVIQHHHHTPSSHTSNSSSSSAPSVRSTYTSQTQSTRPSSVESKVETNAVTECSAVLPPDSSCCFGEQDDGSNSDGLQDNGDEEDVGMDPEELNAPWVCTLKIRRSSGSSSSSRKYMSQADLSSTLRQGRNLSSPNVSRPSQGLTLSLKLGTLSPTPHHSKVIARLKTPVTLPHVSVESMSLQYQGAEQPPETSSELELTPDELRSIMCSTGMWLAFRANFGGVRQQNKGGGR